MIQFLGKWDSTSLTQVKHLDSISLFWCEKFDVKYWKLGSLTPVESLDSSLRLGAKCDFYRLEEHGVSNCEVSRLGNELERMMNDRIVRDFLSDKKITDLWGSFQLLYTF